MRDPAHPENEGKVFLYKFGKKIYDKITAAMQPEFEDETPINPFDLWEGANFKLKICKVAGYWNYDKSEFDSASALHQDDDELERIWKQQYSLSAFTATDQFKTYEELQARLNEVLGINKRSAAPTVDDEEFEPVVPSTPKLSLSLRRRLKLWMRDSMHLTSLPATMRTNCPTSLALRRKTDETVDC